MPCVGRPDVDREADAAAVADVGQGPVPLERGELVGERNQRLPAAFEHVAVARAQRADERRRRLAALIDEMRQRVQVVEEEMRIDLAAKAFELGREARLFDPGAAHAVALPVAQQEHGLVDMGDRHDERDDGEDGGGQRVVARAGIAGDGAPQPEQGERHRDRVEADERQQHAEAAPRPQQPVLPARQPEVEPPVAFPHDERDKREPAVGEDQLRRRVAAVIDQAGEVDDQSPEEGARQHPRPEVVDFTRVPPDRGLAVVHPATTVSAKRCAEPALVPTA